MSVARSVLVCGGGVVGLCCAWYLARAGMQVTVLEQNAEGADSCAHGSAGYVSPSHVAPLSAPGMVLQGLRYMLDSRSPFYIKPRLDAGLLRWGMLFARHCTLEHQRRAAPLLRDLCLGSLALYEEFEREHRDSFGWAREGVLNLCTTAQGLEHEASGPARLAREMGIEARVLDAAQTAQLEPAIAMNIAGAVYFPTDAHLTPRRFMPLLLAELKRAGVAFQWNTTVQGFSTTGERIRAVRTDRGEFAAEEIVLCGGSWSGQLAATLGLRLPMQAGKGYSLTLPEPRLLPRIPMILVERRIAVTPMGAALRFGGTMEIAGHDDRVRPQRVEQIVAGACEIFPQFSPQDFSGIEPWSGFRPLSPDGLPYIGRFARYPNLIAACGHAMLGLTLAPVTGRLVSELVAGERPCVDLALTRPERFD